jgi:hypothetical protein
MTESWTMAAMVAVGSLWFVIRYFPIKRVRVPGTVLNTAETAFQYEFDGRTYVGSRLSDPETGFLSRGRAAVRADDLQPGAAVVVLVDPRNPRDAVLSAGRLPRFLLGVLGLAVAVVIAARS